MKPVAIRYDFDGYGYQYIDSGSGSDWQSRVKGEPLYTHPVKEYKEPSVKEIDDLWLDVINNIPANDHRPREWHFANAILTKASENE
jgi:hypothetical protein